MHACQIYHFIELYCLLFCSFQSFGIKHLFVGCQTVSVKLSRALKESIEQFATFKF